MLALFGHSFVWELVKRAIDSSIASMGTTALAIGGSLLFPLAKVIRTVKESGFTGLRTHWQQALRDSAIIAIVWWSLLFSWHLFYKVPAAIREDARKIKPPDPIIWPVRLPKNWDARAERHAAPAFSVIIEDRIFSPGRNVPTHFRIFQQNPDGSCNLRPVDVIFFIRITNLQKTDAMISAYNVGFGKGEYQRINMLASALEWVPDKGTTPKIGTTIMWGQGPGIGHLSLQEVDKADPSKAASVINAQILDWELTGKYLGPGKFARGWAFFQHPKGWVIQPGQDRTVKITDQGGTVFTYKIPHKNPEGNPNGDILPRTTTIGPITDLSRCSLER